eukprot:3418146-Amphidinium_carterae.1
MIKWCIAARFADQLVHFAAELSIQTGLPWMKFKLLNPFAAHLDALKYCEHPRKYISEWWARRKESVKHGNPTLAKGVPGTRPSWAGGVDGACGGAAGP